MGPHTGTHTVVVALPHGASRAEVRRICGRLHDLAGVVAVELAADGTSIRVLGDVRPDQVRAAMAERARER